MRYYSLIIILILIIQGCSNTQEILPKKQGSIDEKLNYSLPNNWKIGNEIQNKKYSIKEFIPSGQFIESSNEIFTSQIFYKVINQSALEFAEGMKQYWKSICPKAKFSKLTSLTENGYDTAYLKVGCSQFKKTGKPEYLAVKVIKGNESLYVLQKSWKTIPESESYDLWGKVLARVFLCDLLNNAHSCSNKAQTISKV